MSSPFCKKCKKLICNGICECNRPVAPKKTKWHEGKVHFGFLESLCGMGGDGPTLTDKWVQVTCEKCLSKRGTF